ncbi:MAG TPA: flagellar biosynthesis anti-sigma factor FlgM [Burkholderiaceae bacterium]|nr:flagellar biosynthesis anti-sigma factor FlgM [bacterium SGD-2]HZH56220.1 flagellar biosynthesis anti-sigma factor FlgM [Burkholderiaceae bacterium]
MKITPNPIKSQLAGSIAATRTPRGGSGAASAAGGGGKAAAVDLSAAARHLAALHNGENDIDVAKVQELRDAIASGNLKIDTSRIAESLIASARELLK